MNTYKFALKHLIKNKISIKDEKISINLSLNRVSSSDIISSVNYPSCDNTAFDGYAISSKETNSLNLKNPKKFKIIKTLAAGDNPYIRKIPKYSAIEVMTGAIVQKPFDTIIPVEKAELLGTKSKSKYIVIKNKFKKNEFIRPSGSDFKKGDKIIRKGQFINSNHILALKTLGIEKILVKKKLNVVFYPTGNELSNSKKISNWKIRNSNTNYLNSFTKNLPVNFVVKKILRDNDNSIFKKEISKNMKSKSDLVITSGAVSAGKFDFIPNVVKQFKLKSMFKGVNIRPGKPIMFAKFKNNMCFFGLPGNPISSAACFRFFVLPHIFNSLGTSSEKPVVAKLKYKFQKKKKFTRFIKGKLIFTKNGDTEFEVNKGQESYKIGSFTKSNAWGVFKDGISNFKKGSRVECYSLSGINEFLLD